MIQWPYLLLFNGTINCKWDFEMTHDPMALFTPIDDLFNGTISS